MIDLTRPSILQNIDAEVAAQIAHSRDLSPLDGLRLFLASETHEMLLDDRLKLWYLSPIAIFDMWENEIATGDPRNSLYIKGDEIE
ncbi:MAG: hypothetical protein II180_03240 [Proteobacteria bacterium]|nr:hypothetical protein [Pseudomonadota bacterium]